MIVVYEGAAAIVYDAGSWLVMTVVQAHMLIETRNLSRDLAVSEAHRTDWRTRQQVIWADALHRTLLRSVAY